ncbi:helix-turn-helix domain-containing protein [Brachybacterium endophyticum]|nr:helix-turn-helix transcriptional regulator [Brachybacterium endophyticum]
MSTPSIPEAVGSFVKKVRHDHELTLDQIALAGRQEGAGWSASSVANIEKAQASLTLATLIYLALALGKCIGSHLRLSDLLGDADTVQLEPGRGTGMTREWFDFILNGGEVARGRNDFSGVTEFVLSQEPEGSPLVTEEAATAASIAEVRAARRLGVDVATFKDAAIELWGHSLDDESRKRAGAESTPQARGRVTRHLVHEVRAHLRQD